MTILLKLLFNGLIAIPGLIWSGASRPFAFWTGIALALFSYAVGDLMLLRRTNNTFASMSDFILSFAFLWAACALFFQPVQLPGLFLTAFVLSVAEYFWHDYLQLKGTHHSKHRG